MPVDATRTRRKPAARPGSAAKPAPTGRPAPGFLPTSLKLPADLKTQIDAAANAAGVSPHAYMLKALADATGRARLREQFQADALEAHARMDESGLGYALGDVRHYFERMAQHRAGVAGKPRKPTLKKVA
jgi:predicted transcriptional regulator